MSERIVTGRRRDTLVAVDVLLFVLSGVLALAAAWQAFRAYFTLSSTVPIVSPGQLIGLDVTAVASVLSAIAALVVAVIIRGRWAAIFGALSGVAVILTLILAALLLSPQLMGLHGSENGPGLPSNYQPCYSGSNTCN